MPLPADEKEPVTPNELLLHDYYCLNQYLEQAARFKEASNRFPRYAPGPAPNVAALIFMEASRVASTFYGPVDST